MLCLVGKDSQGKWHLTLHRVPSMERIAGHTSIVMDTVAIKFYSFNRY